MPDRNPVHSWIRSLNPQPKLRSQGGHKGVSTRISMNGVQRPFVTPFREDAEVHLANRKTLKFEKFMEEVLIIQAHERWRLGQALFNHCAKVKPHIAQRLRGTVIDPYYCVTNGSSHYRNAVKFIKSNWDKPLEGNIKDVNQARSNPRDSQDESHSNTARNHDEEPRSYRQLKARKPTHDLGQT